MHTVSMFGTAYIINTDTGQRVPVRVVEKTASFAKVMSDDMFRPDGYSKRANGRWYQVGATRKNEKNVELRFR